MVNFQKDIDSCLDTLTNSGTILYPTDTVWGIGCDATNEAGVSKIFKLKQRPDEKSLIVLVPDEREVLQYVAAVDLAVFDYIENVDRPVTVIYDGAIGLASNLIAADGSIAIRICKDEFCRHLLKRFRKPIVSTSANISGEPTPANFTEIDEQIKNGVDFIVQHRQQETRNNPASRIIRWKNGEATILRP